MRKIAVFASGNGSNFENITVAAEQGRIPGCKVVLCVCDRPGAFVTERAARHGVEIFAFRAKDFANKLGFEKLIADRMDELGVDLGGRRISCVLPDICGLLAMSCSHATADA